MIEICDFDKIYFEIFCEIGSEISPLQNLYVHKVFLDNPGILKNSY